MHDAPALREFEILRRGARGHLSAKAANRFVECLGDPFDGQLHTARARRDAEDGDSD